MHLRHRAARLGAPRTVPSRLARLGTLLPQVSHELREMSLAISDQCNVSFASFWDLGLHIDPEDDATERAVLALADRALAFAAEARLFNPDGTSTLLVASVRCGVSGGVGGLISRFVPTQTSFSPASLPFFGSQQDGSESPLVPGRYH